MDPVTCLPERTGWLVYLQQCREDRRVSAVTHLGRGAKSKAPTRLYRRPLALFVALFAMFRGGTNYLRVPADTTAYDTGELKIEPCTDDFWVKCEETMVSVYISAPETADGVTAFIDSETGTVERVIPVTTLSVEHSFMRSCEMDDEASDAISIISCSTHE